ncbi:ATP-dependent DNA ligase [Pseudaquabacterium rugosum]|uniref:DNA ligase (ATP) n=1 Tax=Pseudaquabacterium rugosum TaxID=2984194 RepID=A0ABU9B9M8_9BURK
MRRFAALHAELDARPGTEDKLIALQAYLADTPPADAAWAVWLLAGGRQPRAVGTRVLRAAAAEAAAIPDWLFEASYEAVGDLAETVALLLPDPAPAAIEDLPLAEWMGRRLPQLRAASPAERHVRLLQWWRTLPREGRFVLIKLIGGGFRVGVSRLLVQRALARHAGLDPAWIAQRMVGWTDARHPPDAAALRRLLAPPEAGESGRGTPQADGSADLRPWPFFLAAPLQLPDETPPPATAADGRAAEPADALAATARIEALAQRLGPLIHWLVEWKYDGIRAQLVRRGGLSALWSRGEELVSDAFPDVLDWARALPPDLVLDGELLVWPAGQPHPSSFQCLQRRLQRQHPGARLLAEAPVCFVAYDLLEEGGADRRGWPLAQRRARLEAVLAPVPPAGRREPDLVDLAWAADADAGVGAGADALIAAVGAPLCSPRLPVADAAALCDWRARAPAHGVEGLMLKPLDAPYGSGRLLGPGAWLKWKVQAMSFDLVLVHAQAGHGRRAGLHTDCTFACWSRRPHDAAEAQAVLQAIAERRPPPSDPEALRLLPCTKAYSGLDDATFRRLDAEIRRQTLERHGPVRSLRPTLMLELACEGVQRSSRHRSGIALRFPRMLRIRDDKPLHDATTLDELQSVADRRPAGVTRS